MIDRKAESDNDIDFNVLTDDDKVRYCFRQLCRRLLDIDSTCMSKTKGCPFHIAAHPMVAAWAKVHPEGKCPEDVQEAVNEMLYADGQGRWCEFPDVIHAAQEYLNRVD